MPPNTNPNINLPSKLPRQIRMKNYITTNSTSIAMWVGLLVVVLVIGTFLTLWLTGIFPECSIIHDKLNGSCTTDDDCCDKKTDVVQQKKETL